MGAAVRRAGSDLAQSITPVVDDLKAGRLAPSFGKDVENHANLTAGGVPVFTTASYFRGALSERMGRKEAALQSYEFGLRESMRTSTAQKISLATSAIMRRWASSWMSMRT